MLLHYIPTSQNVTIPTLKHSRPIDMIDADFRTILTFSRQQFLPDIVLSRPFVLGVSLLVINTYFSIQISSSLHICIMSVDNTSLLHVAMRNDAFAWEEIYFYFKI